MLHKATIIIKIIDYKKQFTVELLVKNKNRVPLNQPLICNFSNYCDIRKNIFKYDQNNIQLYHSNWNLNFFRHENFNN